MLQSKGPIRVLVVDDSATIRRVVSAELNKQADINCIDGAADAFEARERIKAERPDVLVLDVEMPRMSGLDFLRKVMKLRPMPVVMFSALTQSGSHDAVEALSIGAFDCLGKTADMLHDGTMDSLPNLIRAAAASNIGGTVKAAPAASGASPKPTVARSATEHVVLIGSSTGGVDALETVLSGFAADCPPTLITQHMPAEFLASFAGRLDGSMAPRVKLAENNEPLAQGHVYLAPGGDYHLALQPGTTPRCILDPQGKVSGHRPSVNVLFRSAVPMASKVVAAILTGMGADGAEGMTELRHAGARTMAQDAATSTVFGMPRVAWEMGGAEQLVPLDKVSKTILDLCSHDHRQPA
ncbi:MAG: chemotaxis response regulator protein-glutamate methylesterase [Pseudomonadota bacterium]